MRSHPQRFLGESARNESDATRSLASDSPLARSRGGELADHDVGLDAKRVAEREEGAERRLPATALQQRDECLVDLAFERQLRLGKAAFLPELLEQRTDRGSEPVVAFHAAQHVGCAEALQRL